MAKNTRSTEFRKVHVEDFDEDNYRDDALDDDGSIASDVRAREAECRKLIAAGDKAAALRAAVANPPRNTKDAAVKKMNFETVISVITAFKQNEVQPAVDALSPEELNVLMKYIYKGMTVPDEAYSAALLSWHAAVVAAGGVGTIVRVMTDRKQL
eukprot:m.285736 g.285736  ORF g.285736 m.285736 type:complete len:155 (+) comp11434_c0_seq1:41-505(+)